MFTQRHAMAQLVEALCYEPKGCAFDSPRYHWNFSFRPNYGPAVVTTSNRNEYQGYLLGGKGGRCVGLTTLLTSCVDHLEIWEPQHPGTLTACTGTAFCYVHVITS